jgi:predicted TIM-barrel fold metal-dependent hydrolase
VNPDTALVDGSLDAARLLVVSADCHAGPPMETFRGYIPAARRDDFDEYLEAVRAYDERLAVLFQGSANAMQDVFLEREMVAGLWDVDARLADLEADGIVADVIFPQGCVPFHGYPANVTVVPQLVPRADAELRSVGVRAYNRWLADLCAAHPGRHVGVGVVPIRDVAAAVREVEWAAAAGLRSISLPPIADDFPAYNDPVYDPLWAACADAQLPLNTHGASTRFYGTGPDYLAVMFAECDFLNRRALWHLIFSGAFERHPGLELVFTEQRAGWVVPTLRELDSIFDTPNSGIRASLPARPSEYFARQCWVGASFMSRAECDQRHLIGVDRIMWGSDYPHVEGTWPHTTASLRKTFDGVPSDEVRLMLGENAVRCYHLDEGQLRAVAERIGPSVGELRVPFDGVPRGGEVSWAFRHGTAWY